MPGRIAALSVQDGVDVADIALDESDTVQGIEQNPPNATDDAIVAETWRYAPTAEEIRDPADAVWVEALAAGITMVLLDAGQGRIPLGPEGVQAALASFRRGVSFVVDLE